MRKEVQDLIFDIKRSLPSRRMMDVVSVGVVCYKGKTVILKSRYLEKDLPAMTAKNPFIKYDRLIEDFNYSYEELFQRNVIFDTSLLGRRGHIALKKLVELSDKSVITEFSY